LVVCGSSVSGSAARPILSAVDAFVAPPEEPQAVTDATERHPIRMMPPNLARRLDVKNGLL
jgi:hypothetical protein